MAVIKSGASSDQWTVDTLSKAGRVTLYDAGGHAIESYQDIGGDYHIGASIMQSVYSSTKNSSTAQINTGVEWIGDSESSMNFSQVQVNTFLDKYHQVTVYQSTDGNNWDLSDSWTNPASYGNSRNVGLTGAFYKVGVKNLAGTNTSIVRIQSALLPVGDTMPRALTTGGNIKVTLGAEWQNTRRTTGLYGASTFRTIGVAAGTQNIMTIENPAASLINIAIRQLAVMSDSTVALTSVAQQIQLSRPTGLPTGGTALTAVKYQTSYASPTAIVRGGTASDGGGATAITATAGATIWQQMIDRPHTSVGWMTHPNYNLIPDVGADLRQIILVPGEALLVQGVTSIPNTTHVIVQVGWLEIKAL